MLIGLTGKAGAGKDSVADILEREAGFRRYALAQPIKDALCAMLRTPEHVLFARERKELPLEKLGISPRRLAQTLGTEWGRALRSDFWLALAERHVDLSADTVITDIRFPDEAEWILSQGGFVVKVIRYGVKAVEAHASEAGIPLDLVQSRILNIGTLQDLEEEVRRRLPVAFLK